MVAVLKLTSTEKPEQFLRFEHLDLYRLNNKWPAEMCSFVRIPTPMLWGSWWPSSIMYNFIFLFGCLDFYFLTYSVRISWNISAQYQPCVYNKWMELFQYAQFACMEYKHQKKKDFFVFFYLVISISNFKSMDIIMLLHIQ